MSYKTKYFDRICSMNKDKKVVVVSTLSELKEYFIMIDDMPMIDKVTFSDGSRKSK